MPVVYLSGNPLPVFGDPLIIPADKVGKQNVAWTIFFVLYPLSGRIIDEWLELQPLAGKSFLNSNDKTFYYEINAITDRGHHAGPFRRCARQ